MRSKILVVDDDQPVLLLMKKLLREYKFDPIVAESGAEAVSLARSEKPSLILLDLNMPRMNGDQVIRQIRAEEELSGVPILILSGEPMSRRDLKSLGADGAIQKPFDLDDLIQQIQSRIEPIRSTP